MAAPELQPFPAQPIAPTRVYRKILGVKKRVGRIQKRGRNKFHNYDYATEADVTDKVREACLEEGLVMIPHVKSVAQREKATREGHATITQVFVTYRVVDVETGESVEFDMPGEGMDSGDKSIAKAITSAGKYADMKLFMIPTGDDPEADEKTDEATHGVTEQDVREVFDPTPVDQAEEMRRAAQETQKPAPKPPAKTAPRPRKSDAISEGKVRRLYALMHGEARRLETSVDAVKVQILNRLGADFGLEHVEDIPWRGDTYKTVCGWLGAVDNANQ